ncbi:hypothetical protein GLAREA_05917 [Glarea lozoyensis ATCC 20868]|uniref:Xylanolytic transcriptional activator regulatory domain-containing protein n=1 Tax=Glarea lozoyensis (strain ATCC 20868 / MF5171) TaxID=1116229 RepID=S3D552_GLAL2|nr:uncharacterized protein GLAREA_05917 [Glarea lozoyensis ATCC 20868]EPE32905.1 hypothetical protein GLAREA_05917 [Glarea lozoyensis ATCC 20868]
MPPQDPSVPKHMVMLRWQPANQKKRLRKRIFRACEDCRKKKTRCEHGLESDFEEVLQQGDFRNNFQTDFRKRRQEQAHVRGDDNVEGSASREGSQDSSATPSPFTNGDRKGESSKDGSAVNGMSRSVEEGRSEVQTTRTQNREDVETLGSRFIGDLNPEGTLLVATSPDAVRSASTKDGIGVWISQKTRDRTNIQQPSEGRPSQVDPATGYPTLFHHSMISRLEEEARSTVPPSHNIAFLSKLYFENCYPILPIIDRYVFDSYPPTDPRRVLLEKGICLAASRNFIAKDYLFLLGSEAPVSCTEFGHKISGSMQLSIDFGIVTDKIVIIQALLLMCQYANGPEGGEWNSQFCAKAIHHCHTIGLHLQTARELSGSSYGARLLCCIWALDRMNAAFNGRPVLMHERDIGLDMFKSFQEQKYPCFRLLLEVVKLLDKVIRLYRPSTSASTNLEDGFPSFEELIMDCKASQAPTPLIATVETLYLAVSMLSFRSKSPEDPHSSSPSLTRQTLASLHLTTTTTLSHLYTLTLFPFIPYAISLSLSIAYRRMRHSKIAMYRARAQKEIQATSLILEQLGEFFWSAGMMAKMGLETVREVERVAVAVVGREGSRLRSEVGHSNDSHAIVQQNSNTIPPPIPTPPNPNPNPHLTPPTFNPSMFDSLTDIDLFDMFDPNFDLNGIDAALQGNLDLSFPTEFS